VTLEARLQAHPVLAMLKVTRDQRLLVMLRMMKTLKRIVLLNRTVRILLFTHQHTETFSSMITLPSDSLFSNIGISIFSFKSRSESTLAPSASLISSETTSNTYDDSSAVFPHSVDLYSSVDFLPSLSLSLINASKSLFSSSDLSLHSFDPSESLFTTECHSQSLFSQIDDSHTSSDALNIALQTQGIDNTRYSQPNTTDLSPTLFESAINIDGSPVGSFSPLFSSSPIQSLPSRSQCFSPNLFSSDSDNHHQHHHHHLDSDIQPASSTDNGPHVDSI
jgi:hypothetical protein